MEKIEIKDLIMNYLGLFINSTQFIAIGLANFAVATIFSKFLVYNTDFVFYSIISSVFSVLLLKPDTFFWFRNINLNTDKVKKNNKLPSHNRDPYIKKIIKYNFWNAILIFFRILFFNLMDEIFIVIVIWLAFLGPFYFLNWVSLVNNFSITTFSEIMAVIGIISGFLQIYINQLKNNIIQKVTNAIIQYIKLSTLDISFTDFLHYLKNTSPQDLSLYHRIKEIIFGLDSITRFGGRREKITERYFYSLSGDELLYLFSYLDSYEEFEEKESGNSRKLQEYYERYFKEKLDKFKLKVKTNAFEINNIKRILYTNIQMLSEAMTDAVTINISEIKETKNPKTFEEFYSNYTENCITLLLEEITNGIFSI